MQREGGALEREIDRTAQSLREVELEIASLSTQQGVRHKAHRPYLPMPELTPVMTPAQAAATSTNRAQRRKEIEARRFSGKEPVNEYILQFELTARRNGWTDEEKALSLLCALDGPARGILTELGDAASASYESVKAAIVSRFGPTRHAEVHEQALQELRLQKGQTIRELAQEVSRATKLAYPDISGPAKERIAIKHLLQAVGDRDVAFYVKDKDPSSLQEACALYEKYKALSGVDCARRAAKQVRADDTLLASAAKSGDSATQRLTAAITQLTDATNRQFKELTSIVDQLRGQISARPTCDATTGRATELRSHSDVPKKPCPRCGQKGHWARQCPQPRTDSRLSHNYSQPSQAAAQPPFLGPPPAHLNFLGPPPASSAGPHQTTQY